MKATEAYKETKMTGSVTKFKLVLLRAQQADKQRRVVGAKNKVFI